MDIANVMQHGRHPQYREQDWSTVQTDVGSIRSQAPRDPVWRTATMAAGLTWKHTAIAILLPLRGGHAIFA